MKKLLFLLGCITLLFAGIGMVSCSDDKNEPTEIKPDDKDDDKDDDNDDDKKEGTSFTAMLSADMGVTWDKNVKLGTFSGDIVEALAFSSVADDGKASFKTTKPLTGNVYVCYPYAETLGKDAGKLKVNIPAAQTQGTEYSFFYGNQTIAETTPVHFDLKSTFAVLELNISTDGYGIGSALSEVTVSAVDAKLTGDFDVDLTASSVVAKVNETYLYGDAATLKMAGDAALLKTDAPVKARIVINPDQLEGKELNIVVRMGEDSWTFTEAGRNFLANKVYSIDLSLSTPAINLNRTEKGLEYANCYIVNQPNTLYKFDAKVQGNGKATPGITPQVIEPKFAFVVWESTTAKGGIIKNVELSEDGFITFTTSEQIGGNALIAVTDGVEEEGLPKGTILWSWHIWSTDYDSASDIEFTTTGGNTFSFMSVNLGTFDDPNDWGTLGLKYQWGRKDPFPSSGFDASGSILVQENYNIMPGYSDDDYGWEAINPALYGVADILAESIAYPAVFMTSTGNMDWLGTGSSNDDLWGNSSNGLGVKTIYDPSPIGYRVPPQLAFVDFVTADVRENSFIGYSVGGKTLSFIPTSYMRNTGVVSNASYGIKYLNDLSTYQVSGRYWTSSVGDEHTASAFYFDKTSINTKSDVIRVCGYPIRCIRE